MRFKNDFILLTLALLSAGAATRSQSIEAVTVGLPDIGQSFETVRASDDLRYLAFFGSARLYGPAGTPRTGLIFADTVTNTGRFLEGSGTISQTIYHHDISGDGRFVVYTAAPSTGTARQIRLYDSTAGTNVLITKSPLGVQGNGTSEFPTISRDGRYIVFETTASNLHPSDTDTRKDVYLYDRTTNQFEVLSNGNPTLGTKTSSFYGSISRDGRFVAFTSNSQNLVPNDLSGQDIFVLDRQNGTISRANVTPTGGNSQGSAFRGWIDPTGQYVLFHGSGSDLAPGAPAATASMFLRDLATNTTYWTGLPVGFENVFTPNGSHILLSPSTAAPLVYSTATRTVVNLPTSVARRGFAATANLEAYVFSSTSNLTPDDLNTANDIYRRTISTGTTTRLLVGSGPAMLSAPVSHLVVSADGSSVAWTNSAPNLSPWPTPASTASTGFRRMTASSAVPYDRTGLSTFSPANTIQRISDDGAYLLSQGGTGLKIINTLTGGEQLIGRDFLSGAPVKESHRTGMSRDGRYVSFVNSSPRLVDGLSTVQLRGYLYDRLLDKVSLVTPPSHTVSTSSTFAGLAMFEMDIDGQVIDFVSSPTGGTPQTYRYAISSGITTVSPDPQGIVAPYPLNSNNVLQQFELDSPYRFVDVAQYPEARVFRSPSPNLRLLGTFVGTSSTTRQLAVRDLESGRLMRLPAIISVGQNQALVFSRDLRYVFFSSEDQLTEHVNLSNNYYRIPVPSLVDSAPRFEFSLTGFEGNLSTYPVIVEVIQNGNVVEEVRPAVTQGNTFIVAPFSTGPATLRIRNRASLAKRLDVTLGPGLQPLQIQLLNGDINRDNEIGPADFSALAARYDLPASRTELADLNGDLEIGAADYSILAANYGAVGE